MKYKKEDVVKKLENYTELRRTVMQLQYELNHVSVITGDEVIEAMTFSKSDGDRMPASCVSDKTLRIALNYSDQRDFLNKERLVKLRAELLDAETEMARLEYYISLLEEKYAAVLRTLYFEGATWREVHEKLKISPSSIPKYRNAGILKLTEMYNRLP